MKDTTVSAEVWFREFTRLYVEAATTSESEIALSVDDDHSAEWTAVMGLFLRRMARKLGYRQTWERPVDVGTKRPRKLDYAWTDSNGSLALAIEHHSWYSDAEKYSDKIITILMARAPLGVLITYVPSRESRVTEDVRKGIEGMLRVGNPGEFLLVLADLKASPTNPWWAYTWNSDSRTLRLIDLT